jgi:homoserine dehydrogenase
MKAINVGLLGFGTVGRGVFSVLQRNREEISRRAGRDIEIRRIAVRDTARAQAALKAAHPDTLNTVRIDADPAALVDDPELDIIIEAIGGTNHARALVLRALANKKHVVTANKALLAAASGEIFNTARLHGAMVAFEAAVAGGIPIIKVLREGLAANRIQSVVGIINGTTNFILSEMRTAGIDFATALGRAQQLGYAEADPSLDIEGVDAAHKITIVSAIAFGIFVQFKQVYIEGISALSVHDIEYAETLGYRIKLLGITRRTEAGIELRVHPTLIPVQCLLANVENAMNAIVIQGDVVGETLYYGKGAGAEPTASAIIADLVDVTRLHTSDPEQRVPHLAFQSDQLANLPILGIEDIQSRYYLRLRVADTTGVLAKITTILADHAISVDALLQKPSYYADDAGSSPTHHTDLILITHTTLEKQMNAAITRINSLATVTSNVVRLRIETLAAFSADT